MTPIALVGNCQASALSVILKQSDVVDCRLVLDVNCRGSEYFTNILFALYGKSGIAQVLSQPIGEDFDDISSARLGSHYQQAFANYTNIYFSGLQPDLTYFGGFGRRITSPLGDYHSRIVLASFIQDRSPEACVASFNGATYERLGYFLQFDHSMAELERRDETTEIKFAARFAEMSRARMTMHSVNHPTLDTMVELARAIEAHVGDRHSIEASRVSGYPLDSGPIWPIYPEIREQCALPYETPFRFRPAEGAGEALSLEDFVLASYGSYEKQGRSVLEECDIARAFANLPVA